MVTVIMQTHHYHVNISLHFTCYNVQYIILAFSFMLLHSFCDWWWNLQIKMGFDECIHSHVNTNPLFPTDQWFSSFFCLQHSILKLFYLMVHYLSIRDQLNILVSYFSNTCVDTYKITSKKTNHQRCLKFCMSNCHRQILTLVYPLVTLHQTES